MIHLDNYKLIYYNARLMVKILKHNMKKNIVSNYFNIIKNDSTINDILKNESWATKVLCAFTAVELYDNPELPNGTPLVVANNMYYFTLLSNSEVKNTKDCKTCDGSGEEECISCSGNGEILCDECGGNGEISCDECGGDGEDSDGNSCENCQGWGKLSCNNCSDGYLLCQDCDGTGKVTCNSCGGDGKNESEEYVNVSSDFYLSTDQELFSILKSRANTKKNVTSLYSEKIYNASKTFFISGISEEININVNDVKSIVNYQDDFFVTNINKVKSVNNIDVKSIENTFDTNKVEEYFED